MEANILSNIARNSNNIINRLSQILPFLVLVFVFVCLLVRNLGLYPVVFSDEFVYSRLSGVVPLHKAHIPLYLYLSVFSLTSYCGDGFLDCARVFNGVFFMSAIPFIYMIARQICSRKLAHFIVIITALSPINTYTAYFMPEATYFFAFWFFSWFILSHYHIRNYYYGMIAGLMLGMIVMIKVRAIFFIPGVVIFVAYRMIRSDSSNWFRQTLIICCNFIVFTFITRLVFGYIFAGTSGLSMLGGRADAYDSIADLAIGTGHDFHLASAAIGNLQSHVMALVILFGVPLSSLFLILSKEEYCAEINDNLASMQVYACVVIATFLILTALFTASTVGIGPYETIARLHMRYYNYALPFFFIIAASQLSTPMQKANLYSQIIPALVIGVFSVYSIATLLGKVTPGLVDCPELRGVTYNVPIFYFLGGIGTIAVLLWGYNRKLAAQSYVFLFMPLSMFTSAYYENGELRRALVPNVYDKAGMLAKQYMEENERSQIAIATSEPGGLFRTIFYLDNPRVNASAIVLPPGAPLDVAKIPPGTEWVLIIGEHEFPSMVKHQISMTGFSLLKLAGDDLIDFKKSSWPGLVNRASGLAAPEEWGSWSNAKKVKLDLKYPLPKEFDLHLQAHAFGPNIDHTFVFSIGRDKRNFRLSSLPQDIELSFKTDGTEKSIVIEIPKPISPKELGLSSDDRQLGIGLAELRIESK
ncbi:MAG: glycosyltransferase family 39 protein [Methylococcaceae bacterium]|nr:glycosyltransferase family 39 protein [Methylococcaceae bacterium]